MKADLHLHTTTSDGRLTPAALVRVAAEKGLDVIAITDHDSVGGIYDATLAARSFPPLKVISGVELNTDIADGDVHCALDLLCLQDVVRFAGVGVGADA